MEFVYTRKRWGYASDLVCKGESFLLPIDKGYLSSEGHNTPNLSSQHHTTRSFYIRGLVIESMLIDAFLHPRVKFSFGGG